ncbi:TIGR02099 family protein [Bordetella sp. 15P40C-2]|nr:TIGR02099 family protein [Bordetella sp. 15P40C-2]
MPVLSFTKVLRGLFWAAFTVYVLAAGILLGLRYWVLPNIDQWRPRIEGYISQALGQRVQIGQIEANWRGLNPAVRLDSVLVYNAEDLPVLKLPTVSAVLGWRSILALSPRFLSLRVDGADITLRRDEDDRVWVAGRSFKLGQSETNDDPGSAAVWKWLGKQRDLAVAGGTVHWQDELRHAPVVTFNDVTMRLSNGLLSHRVAVSARPPQALAQAINIRGEFQRQLLNVSRSSWTGELYAQLDDAEPQAWRPWVPAPAVAGRMAARAWLTWEKGELTDLSADALVRELRWQAEPRDPARPAPLEKLPAVSVTSGSLHVQGPPASMMQSIDPPKSSSRKEDPGGIEVRAELNGLATTLPGMFEPAQLQVDAAKLDGRVQHFAHQPLQVDVRALNLANADLEARLQGRWSSQGKTAAGSADISGTLVRGSMPAIYKYLPVTVNVEAREWLARGLPAGQARDAAVTVRGDLDDFPFEDEGDEGEFRIAGAYHDAIVDYAPPGEFGKGWPRLEKMNGNFVVDKVSLALDTPGGGIAHTGKGQTLKLGAVKASIPNMEHGATLLLDGRIMGSVPAYLALAKNYELGELIGGLLDEAEGSGEWTVPLKLEVPLLHAEDTKVNGAVVFKDNNFRFVPEMPMLHGVRGELAFSEEGVRVPNVQAQFLGGPARVSGKLERPEDRLHVEGTVTAAAVRAWAGVPLLDRLSGQTAYTSRIGAGPGGALDISLSSDLAGLGIDFPAPLGKDRAAKLPLKAHWGETGNKGGQDLLSVTLGSDLSLQLEHDRDSKDRYFGRVALGVNQKIALPDTPGLAMDIQLPELNLDAWKEVAASVESPGKSSSTVSADTLLPALEQIRLRVDKLRVSGWDVDDVTLTAQRPRPANWQLDIDAKQVKGSVSWQEASGAIAGRVVARFKHLSLGRQAAVASSMPVHEGASPDEDLSHIPAIDLQADQFVLYGKDVGKLDVQGTNLERGQTWRLDKLQIANDAARLDATGLWRLRGAERGLEVDTKAQIQDLGELLARLGYPKHVREGSGTIEGTLAWRDLPWTRDLSKLDGKLQVSLDDGRFLTVESRGMRVLELLSLQSLQRLATFDANPADALRDGLPFDTIRGDLALNKGVAHSEGFKLNGPVATIALAGDTDLVDEVWNLKAVVIPNLDASGAAVVAGLAVNPLVGLGAFLTQWLLKRPLARAMTLEYAVTGTWDDPKIEPIGGQDKPSKTQQQAVEEHIEH